MSTTDAPARPDLSHLDADVRLRIELAETQGATWEPSPYERVELRSPASGRESDRIFAVRGTGERTIVALVWLDGTGEWRAPDPLADPAAWGALMEKERVGLRWEDNGDCWSEWWETSGSAGVRRRIEAHHLVQHKEPARAVCLAVLAKYGRDTSPYTEAAWNAWRCR